MFGCPLWHSLVFFLAHGGLVPAHGLHLLLYLHTASACTRPALAHNRKNHETKTTNQRCWTKHQKPRLVVVYLRVCVVYFPGTGTGTGTSAVAPSGTNNSKYAGKRAGIRKKKKKTKYARTLVDVFLRVVAGSSGATNPPPPPGQNLSATKQTTMCSSIKPTSF